MAKENRASANERAKMSKGRSKRRFFALSAMMAALLAVFCPWVVPVGIIPVTVATFLLFLFAAVLPRGVSLTGVAVYLAVGALGLPVFASFTGGFGILIGPTGGFLWGYLPCVLLVSLADRNSRWQTPLFMLVGLLILYLFGTAWFALVSDATVTEAVLTAVLPFLLPDLVKLVAASAVAYTLRGRLKRHLP